MRWAGQKNLPNVTEVYYIWFLGRQASVIKNDNKLDLCTNIQKFFLKEINTFKQQGFIKWFKKWQ